MSSVYVKNKIIGLVILMLLEYTVDIVPELVGNTSPLQSQIWICMSVGSIQRAQ